MQLSALLPHDRPDVLAGPWRVRARIHAEIDLGIPRKERLADLVLGRSQRRRGRHARANIREELLAGLGFQGARGLTERVLASVERLEHRLLLSGAAGNGFLLNRNVLKLVEVVVMKVHDHRRLALLLRCYHTKMILLDGLHLMWSLQKSQNLSDRNKK